MAGGFGCVQAGGNEEEANRTLAVEMEDFTETFGWNELTGLWKMRKVGFQLPLRFQLREDPGGW